MRRYLKPLALLLLLLLTLCACTPAELETLDSLVQMVDEVATQMEQMQQSTASAEITVTDEPESDPEPEPAPEVLAAPEMEPELAADPEPETGLEIDPVVEIEIPADPDEEPSEAPIEEPTEIQTELPADEPEEIPADPEPAVIYGDDYYSPEDVALYLHLYQELPPNYLTKSEARDWGWESSEGNLWDVFPGGCIGGDHFGNYEGLLPDGDWTECDVNYEGGYRNGERLVFNEDGAVYYTNDHYESFTQLYEGWAEG